MSAFAPETKPTTRYYLWRMIRYRPGLYVANATLWLLVHVSPLVPGLIAQQFFNTLTGDAPLSFGVGALVALLVGVALARVGLFFGGALTDIPHRFTMSALLRRNLLAHLLTRPGALALPVSVGDAISHFRDDAEQAEDSISWTLDTIGEAVFALVAIIILLRINVRVTLAVFLPLGGVVAVARLGRARVERYRKASRAATANVTGALGEMFDAAQAVQLAGAEERVIAHFRALSESRRVLMLRDRVLTQALDSVFANSVSVGTGLVLLLAAADMRAGTFSLGDFALFVAYLEFVADFTEFLGRFLAHLKQTGVSFERLAGLVRGASPALLVAHEPLALGGPPPPPLAAAIRTPADRLVTLEARDLTYRHAERGEDERGQTEGGRGIRGVSLRVARGEFVVVTGRVGAGKTTLLRALLGLLPAQSGEIRWNGQPIADPAAFFVPPRSAYTPQAPRLFSASLRENILLGLPEVNDQLGQALRAAALEDDVAALEQGLETEIGARGVRLSGGQAQRAAAARMFVRAPELLVIDDLSSALDVETERRLWERLFAREEVTCLAISHRRAALQRADRILVLRDGCVEAEGTLPDLLESSAEMRRLWSGDE